MSHQWSARAANFAASFLSRELYEGRAELLLLLGVLLLLLGVLLLLLLLLLLAPVLLLVLVLLDVGLWW